LVNIISFLNLVGTLIILSFWVTRIKLWRTNVSGSSDKKVYPRNLISYEIQHKSLSIKFDLILKRYWYRETYTKSWHLYRNTLLSAVVQYCILNNIVYPPTFNRVVINNRAEDIFPTIFGFQRSLQRIADKHLNNVHGIYL